MSFILDALTRSEQERQRRTVPSLQTLHLPPAAQPQAHVAPAYYAIGGGVLVAGVVLAWWMWSVPERDLAGQAQREEAAMVAPAPIQRGAVPAGASSTPSATAASAGQPSAPPLAATGVMAAPTPAPAPRSAAPPQSRARASARDTLASIESSIVIIEAPPSTPALEASRAATPAPPPLDDSAVQLPEETEGWTLITPDTLDRRNARGTADEAPRNPVPDSEGQPLYTVHDLPDDVRSQLPSVVFSGHLYSSDPAARMIIVDGGRALSEGQRVAADLYLEEITTSGVILAFRGYRFSAGVVGDWALK